MDFTEIRRTLESASRLPEEELRAALAHTDELLPLVTELIGKLKAGVFLLPDQQWLLIYGLHVLAAAHTTALFPAWCDLLRLPDALETIFGAHSGNVIVRVTLSLACDDSATIVTLLDSAAAEGAVGWALLEVLARMTWDGHADLARTRELLARFERDDRFAAEDEAWDGWLSAVVLLGLIELIPAMERVLAKPVFAHLREADQREEFELLRAASKNFADGARFAAGEIAPFDDPVEGLRWMRTTDDAAPDVEDPADPEEPADPAASIRLSEDEEIWLRDFLDSAQVPETTMNLEALDGFFTALAAGPEPVPPAVYLPEIWGRGKPPYDSPAQQQFVETLFERYREATARRVAANVAFEPFLFDDEGDELASDWGSGFMLAAALRPRAWAPLIRHRSAGRLTASIVALFQDDPEEPLTPDLRRDVVEALPEIVLGIADFWRDPNRGLAEPIRSQKIGRNDPCPCGSGKKYKKCCGSGAAA
jgi:uncharacterized protein